MIPTGLSDVIEDHRIIVTVVLTIDTGKIEVIGDRSSLDSDYIVRTLFDDLTPSEVESYLENQILPRMIQQSDVCGVICKPNSKTVVGMYYHDQRDVIARYDTSKAIDSDVQRVWKSVE